MLRSIYETRGDSTHFRQEEQMGKSPNRRKHKSTKESRQTVSKEARIVEKINSITPSAKRALLGGTFVVIAALILGLFKVM